jgi:hypothetical protein
MRTRVSWICALVSLAIATAAYAAAPPLLPLQGVLTDADGVPLATAVSIRFSLHTAETGGSEVWYETQTVTPVDGLFAAYLGQGTGGTMTLATFRDEGQLWLEVKVGNDDPMARVRLASVGYAGYAEYCGTVPAHTHPAGDLPTGLVIGAQTCSGSDKVRGVSSSGAIVCSPDLGTGPDTLGQLNCTTGQTVKWNGSVWGCANDDNAGGTITAVNAGSGLSSNTVGTVATVGLSGACSATEVLRFDGSAWQCTPAVQAIATPAAGGLAFTTTGATYNLTLKTGCANGQVLKYNGGTSSWDCAADANSGDITDVLVATGGGLSVTNSGGPQPTLALQACQTTGQVLKWDATGSSWGCASDADSGGDITAVLTPNGSGLTGGASSGSASLSLAACNANQVLRSAGSSWGCVDDVTAVNTPSTGGLTGGGAAGALSLKVKDCTAGQVLKSVGTGWDCGADNNSGGTVSSVATGAGLTGGPVTTSGTISIATGGVINTMLANPSLTVSAGTGLSGGGSVALGGTTSIALATPVAIANGGTNATTAAGARTNLGAAASGINTDITALRSLDQQEAIRLNPYGLGAGSTSEIRFQELVANGVNFVGFKAPDALPANQVWTLPTGDGSSGQVLRTDGNGHLAWITPGSGSVTNVGTGAGLTGGPITGTGTISIQTGGVTNAMLVNSGLTVTAGSGLSGGGDVDLGGATSLALDTTQANTWTGLQMFQGEIVLFEAADPTQTVVLTSVAHAGEIAVDANRALRLESTGASPNVILGSVGNSVDSPNIGAAIGGGGNSVYPNTVSASYCTIGGGTRNQCGTGGNGGNSTVGGGYGNSATGQSSTVPGGYGNLAGGDFSFAAGRRAQAGSHGCFVWGDSTDADVSCGDKDQFVARASGGATIYTTANLTTGVTVAAGSGTWTSVSDRNLKQDVAPVDGRAVLAKVAAMPVSTWRYRTEVSGARHLGPMAQDFHAAFGLGDSDRAITTVDADGVALAAIQGLHQVDGELRAENEKLRAQVRTLESRVAQLGTLEQRLAKLEQAQSARGGAGSFGWGAFGLIVAGGLVVARRRRGN